MLSIEKDENPICMSRRNFLFSGGSTIALSSLPGLTVALEGEFKEYPIKKIAKLSSLEQDEQIYFRYPFEERVQCSNFLIKLGEEAGGGVGKKRDIVAFSSFCPHMGGVINGVYNAEHKVAGPCPLHLTTFDLTRHGMVVSGHATESLPQIVLKTEGDAIFAVGVLGLIFGHHNNLQR